MSFNGTEGAPIPLATAATWTANYRATLPVGSTETKGVFFGKDILNSILAQSECMGIRMYFAINGDGVKTLVLVGASADESDQTSGIVADFGDLCPPVCRISVLNS